MRRRLFVASSLAALSGCGSAGDALNASPFHKVLGSAEVLDRKIIGTHGLVRTYRESDISPDFPIDSLATPSDATYTGLQADDFRRYRLVVDGMVDRPQQLDLHALRAMPLQTQITRHDCVEGWSAIAKWRGVRVSDVLSTAKPKQGARFVVFHCFDRDENGTLYYESLNLTQAAHPQTLLALDMNDRPITPDHGAPVRLRIPTQLGYKSAKWVYRIELASTFKPLYGGTGGYWEDQGYEWFAGI